MTAKTTIISAMAALVVASTTALALVPSAGAQEEPQQPTARQERRGAFLERVANLLGIDASRLQDAIKQAQLDIVNEALADGRITEERADKARQRIEDGRGPGLRQRVQEGAQGRRHERRARIRGAIIEQSATAIGITPEDLKTDLRGGSSIAEVASANGVAVDDVKAALLDAATQKLDQAVTNDRIDQAKADEMLEKLSANLDTLLNRKREVPAAP